MTITVKNPSPLEKFTDESGRPTLDAQKFFQQLLSKLAELESRIEALEP